MLLVASVPHCQTLLYILGSFSILGMCSTSLLFFYRVRAVYGNSIFVTYSFGFLWAATFGMSFVFPFASYGGVSQSISVSTLQSRRFKLPDVLTYFFSRKPAHRTDREVHNHIHTIIHFYARHCECNPRYTRLSSNLLPHHFVYRNWWFLECSCEVFLYCGWTSEIVKGFATKRTTILLVIRILTYFSPDTIDITILFSATIGLSLSFAVMLLVPVPSVYRAMLSVPNLALENAMACRVYRAVKLGSIQDPPTTHSIKTLRFNTATAKSSREMPFNQPTSDEPRNTVQVDMTDLEVGVEHKYGKPSLLQGDSDAYDGA